MVLALSLLALPVQAAVDIGKVISSSGSFMAKQSDGQTRKLKRRSKIHEGDLLITGANSQAQIRFKDSSLLELKPNTEFKVDEFSFSGKADGSEKSVYSLIKGGMRTITGKIGKKDKSKYKVNTPVASIGIRGTHYGLQLCTSGSCNGDDGLFGGIYEGAIVLGNESGEHPIGADGWNWFYVPAEGGDPQRLDALPAPMAEAEPDPDATAEEGGEAGDDGTADSGLDEDTDLAVDEEVVAVETAAAPTDTTTPTGDVTDPTTDFQATEQATGDALSTENVTPTSSAAPAGAWLGIAFTEDDPTYGIEGIGEGLQVGSEATITLDTVGTVGNVPIFGSVTDTPPLDADSCNPVSSQMGLPL
ncbi:FecR family protein [Candidatus Reidiella endopervernicosa]|nr:FecR family protein [Candidatus Reidiella endopervernicosa]